jgi:hypothetical protein
VTGSAHVLRTPTAAEVARLLEAEKLGIALGWLDPCPYVGLGPCIRSADHDLPHVTDPGKAETQVNDLDHPAAHRRTP